MSVVEATPKASTGAGKAMSTTPVPGNFDEVNKRITRIEKEISALTVITRSEALLVSYVDVTKFGYERQSYKQMFLDLSKKLIVVDISEKIRSVIKLSSNKENEHQFVVNLLDAELLKLYSGKEFGKKIRELNAERGTRLTISKYLNKVELTNRSFSSKFQHFGRGLFRSNYRNRFD